MMNRFIVVAQNEDFLILSKNNIGEENIDYSMICSNITTIEHVLEGQSKSKPFLIAAERDTALGFADYLNSHGVDAIIFIQEFIEFYRTNVFDVRERFWEKAKRGAESSRIVYEEITGRRLIRSTIVVLGTACNLRCKNCSNFIPLMPKEFKRYKLEKILQDIKCFCKIVDYVPEIQIQGGESFLYSELDKLLYELASMKQINRIVIVTNGTIIPKPEILNAMKYNKAIVRISDYKIKESKVEELKNVLDENDISYFIYEFKRNSAMWYFMGGPDVEEASDDIAKKRFFSCEFTPYVTIQDSTVGYCPREYNASFIQGFSFAENDVVVLDEKDEMLGEKLREYLIHPHMITACKYCYGCDNEKKCIPAEQ